MQKEKKKLSPFENITDECYFNKVRRQLHDAKTILATDKFELISKAKLQVASYRSAVKLGITASAAP
jgi:hypothetical protein